MECKLKKSPYFKSILNLFAIIQLYSLWNTTVLTQIIILAVTIKKPTSVIKQEYPELQKMTEGFGFYLENIDLIWKSVTLIFFLVSVYTTYNMFSNLKFTKIIKIYMVSVATNILILVGSLGFINIGYLLLFALTASVTSVELDLNQTLISSVTNALAHLLVYIALIFYTVWITKTHKAQK